MTKDEYCVQRCKAKCCVMHLSDEGSVPCPKLSDDSSCSVYRERFQPDMPDLVVVGYWKSRKYKDLDGQAATRPFWCGRIEQIIAQGGLKAEIAEQCCYVRPELLEETV